MTIFSFDPGKSGTNDKNLIMGQNCSRHTISWFFPQCATCVHSNCDDAWEVRRDKSDFWEPSRKSWQIPISPDSKELSPLRLWNFWSVLKASSHTKSKYVNLNQSLYGHYNKLLKVNISGERKILSGKMFLGKSEPIWCLRSFEGDACSWLKNRNILRSAHHPMSNSYLIPKESLSLSKNMSNPPTLLIQSTIHPMYNPPTLLIR